MSVDELKPRRVARPPGDAKLVQYDEYIDKQIHSTRRMVKAVDFATAIVLVVTGVLAFLLTAALVEHWLVPGGFNVGVRTLLFVLLVCGVCYFTYRRLWPLVARAINPVYAAQTIEQGSPTLKNSLINLLLFRERRSEISEAVYHTLEEQAAQRLTRVPVDSAVDRSQLIRFGYVLLAVVAAAALYKVFSPKDPLVAAERVLLPWADIVPASRVQIRAVEPGAVTIARGEFLDVSAEVSGIGENDPVQLRFTTADGQAVDKPIVMKPSEAGLRFAGRLPDAADSSGGAGVAQNLTYRIEAGDARSLDYPVTVVAAPAILVERIEYDYPAYTGYVDRKVDGLGDVRAIEGTRVAIHARANGPIDEADVDFDADGRRDLRMSADGTRAKATFELALREDRQTPKHLSYVLRFTNTDGRANRDPVKHPIDVVPDYSPEASILAPQEKSLDVRVDQTVVIEVEARDPDFALAAVRLHGEAAGRRAIDVPLLKGEHVGKFNGQFRFTPSEHKLQAGDVVQYWVAADDIRTPKANSTATERRVFRITSPDPAQPPPDRIAQRDQQRQPSGKQGEPQNQGGGEGEGEQGEGGNQGGENGEQQPGNQPQDGAKEGQNGESGQSGGQPQQGSESGANEGQEGGQSGTTKGERGGGENQEGANESQPQDQQQGAGGGKQQSDQPDPQPGQHSQPGEQDSGKQNGENSNGKQTGAGAAGSESSQDNSQPDGARPDGNQRSQPSQGNERNGPPSESTPVSPEGDDDGAAFNRIREHLEKSGELNEGGSEQTEGRKQQGEESASEGGNQSSSGDANSNGKQQSPDKNSPQPNPGAEQRDEQNRAEQGAKSDGESTKPDGGKGEPTRDGDKTPPDGAGANDEGEGTGAETRQDDLAQKENEPSKTGEKTKSPGGQQSSTKGPSGAGEQPDENQGAPDSKEGMKPAEKREQSPSGESKSDDKEPPAPGEGKRETDSQGEMGGDRPGGGEEGGGQKANRDGTGSAGQNQSADEGGGESSEKGTGNNSPNAGQDAEADHKTRQPGSEKSGPGSTQRDGQGQKPGGEGGAEKDAGSEPARAQEKVQNDAKSDGQGDESAPAAGQQSEQQNDSQDSNRSGTATGSGGDTGTAAGPPSATEGTAPEADPANLEYARKQTDLVLEKLADQLKRKGVDEQMLKELGWTEDDLRTFVERWKRRKEAARRADPAAEGAQRELDDALRSLGLRRGPLRQTQAPEDNQRDMREGYRGPVPAEYQERLRAYNQGVSRARQDGE